MISQDSSLLGGAIGVLGNHYYWYSRNHTIWYYLVPWQQVIQHTSKQKMANGKRQAKREEEIGKERANKTTRMKWGEENERQMANNVNAREMGL